MAILASQHLLMLTGNTDTIDPLDRRLDYSLAPAITRVTQVTTGITQLLADSRRECLSIIQQDNQPESSLLRPLTRQESVGRVALGEISANRVSQSIQRESPALKHAEKRRTRGQQAAEAKRRRVTSNTQ